MKNPLKRRVFRELKGEFAKYAIISIFLIIVIGFISGFLVVSGSIRKSYDEGFEKYNIEDGNFEYSEKADAETRRLLEKENVTIYENFYIEKETDNVESILRIYKNREKVDKISLMEGELPLTENEIAIDRMYADNNDLAVGDILSVDGKELTISGLVALSDYNALFENTSDMMFDAIKFGVAVMTEDGFDCMGTVGLHYSYAWTYKQAPADVKEEKEMSQDFKDQLLKYGMLKNFVPRYLNQSIVYADTDMGNDRGFYIAFLFIVVAIIAFIFAVTTSDIITKEASVIGTLRASGYTKGEMLRHYITLPVSVTILSALIGNILGYTVFVNVSSAIYYSNYSLPPLEIAWNADAFLKTTVVPVLLMIVINYVIIANKLKLSPMKFLRRDLSKRKKKKAFKLNSRIGIMNRFRLRIIFQNMPNYLTIVAGIFFANVIMVFGVAFPALLENYQGLISDSIISNYQYVLKGEAETDTEGAEKYCAASLITIEGKLKSEDVSIFGLKEDSRYISLNLANDNAYISSSYAEKYGISAGDTITLKEEYGDKEYRFLVKGIHNYSAGIAVFISQEYFNEIFENEADYFNGYLSAEEIEDIDEAWIATVITEDDINKISRQLMTSMGGLFDIFFYFGLVMFMMIIYLLSKLVIEKNTQSISMTKILGYKNREIGGLYIVSTSLVVLISFIVTMPLINKLMESVCMMILCSYSGWIPYYIPASEFVKIIIGGILVYAVIVFMQYGKVKKIPLDVALKNVE